MNIKRSFSLALKGTGQAPCEAFNCPLAGYCAARAEQCTAFSVYVTTGRAVDPINTYKHDRNGAVFVKRMDDRPRPNRNEFLGRYGEKISNDRAEALLLRAG